VFASFPGGQYVGIAFFVLVLFASATSAISLLETNVQTLSQELKISRAKAIVINVSEIVCVGVVTILGYSLLSFVKPLNFISKYSNFDILDTLDFISNSVLMPIGAMFTTVLVVAVVGIERISKENSGNGTWYREWVFQFCMCVVVIPCLLIVLLNAVGLLG
jgi:NSS family neurotransmitter:Na+ symporter